MESRENRPFAYEIKFLVPAGRADEIRNWARRRLFPDPNAEGGEGDTYRITSLYFDTPEFGVFHRDGSHGRAKYRVRRYDSAVTVFLERKLRADGIVTKRRMLIPIHELKRLEEADTEWRGNWFRRRVHAREMSPSCQISYVRTALVGQTGDGLIRLTLDDGLCASPVSGANFRSLAGSTPMLNGQSILEMKFRMAMPALFKEIVKEYKLSSRPVSKYRLAIPALGLAHDHVQVAARSEVLMAAYA